MRRCVLHVTIATVILPNTHGMQAYNQSVADRLPLTMDVKEFLTAVHSLGQKDEVTISSVAPGITSGLIDVQAQSVRLTIMGRFHAVVQLMFELETTVRMVELTEIEAVASTKPGETEDMIEVKLDARLFARPAKAPILSQNDG